MERKIKWSGKDKLPKFVMGMVTIVTLVVTINVAIAFALILQVATTVMLYFAGLIMEGHMLNTAVQNTDVQHVAIDKLHEIERDVTSTVITVAFYTV